MELHIKKWHIYLFLVVAALALGLAIIWFIIRPQQQSVEVAIQTTHQKAVDALKCSDSLQRKVIPAMENQIKAQVESTTVKVQQVRKQTQLQYQLQLKEYEKNIRHIDSLPGTVQDSLLGIRLSKTVGNW